MTGCLTEWRYEVLGRGIFLQYRLQTNGLLLRKCLKRPVASLTLVKVQWKYVCFVGVEGTVRGILQLWVHPSNTLSLLDQRERWVNNKRLANKLGKSFGLQE